jgi:hypothetical protein
MKPRFYRGFFVPLLVLRTERVAKFGTDFGPWEGSIQTRYRVVLQIAEDVLVDIMLSGAAL